MTPQIYELSYNIESYAHKSRPYLQDLTLRLWKDRDWKYNA